MSPPLIKGGPHRVNDLTRTGLDAIIKLGVGGPAERAKLADLVEVVMPTRAVLFGFDGVLADTENVQIAAWQRTFRAMGWNEAEESCLQALGGDDRTFVAEVFARRKIERGDVDGWVARKRNLTVQLLRDRPRLLPGVAELVQALREADVALAVTTTARRINVETVLAASGLLDSFDVVVAGDDATETEGYGLILAKLNLAPADVVTLERSSTGINAALDAGVRVVAVSVARLDDLGTDPEVRPITLLPDLIGLNTNLAALGI